MWLKVTPNSMADLTRFSVGVFALFSMYDLTGNAGCMNVYAEGCRGRLDLYI